MRDCFPRKEYMPFKEFIRALKFPHPKEFITPQRIFIAPKEYLLPSKNFVSPKEFSSPKEFIVSQKVVPCCFVLLSADRFVVLEVEVPETEECEREQDREKDIERSERRAAPRVKICQVNERKHALSVSVGEIVRSVC